MSTHHLEIHSENILPIIKKWLYSEKDIFVRELVSNACDAIHKLKILIDCKEADIESEFSIHIEINKEKKTLTFTDTGIGMSADEVKQYIAQIAFSGAEAFVEKYKGKGADNQIIGHFGLGFYSAYMVADVVEIETLSYKEGSKSAYWRCDGSAKYELGEGKRETRGTEITLHLGKENEEYLDENKMREVLERFCRFLPYPIFLGQERINSQEPLWIKPTSECTKEDYLDFYRYLYPYDAGPLFWVHLNVDYPFHLKGILYFPKLDKQFDLKKSTVHLYCNRVFVADNCKDVLPEYLTALRGVIDSPDIPLNVSRSTLQSDRTVRQLATHISKKVAESLILLYKTEKERFFQCWKDVSFVVKLGALEDEKFYERIKELLLWKTTQGEWIHAQEYIERNKDKLPEKIIYATDEQHNVPLINLFREKNIDILCMDAPIDHYLINHLERHLKPVKFQRLDGAVEELLIRQEKPAVNAEQIANAIEDLLNRREEIKVEAKSLSNVQIPALLIVEENQRRLKEYMRLMGSEGSMKTEQTLVVNTNNPLICAIEKLKDKDKELAKELVDGVYELSQLSQREIEPQAINTFIERTARLMEKLAIMAGEQ